MFIMQVGYGTLARIARIRVDLLSVWGSDVYEFPYKSKFNYNVFRKNILYANNIASTSNIMAEKLKSIVPNLDKSIYITPFGVDIDKFKKCEKKDKSGYIYIGNVKSLKKIYGIKYGILAFKDLKEKVLKTGNIELASKLKMKIYGDGEEEENLQRLILDNNLEDDIFLMGRIPNDEVPSALNDIDIFCVTSLNESFGVAIIEAMACEIPVVATDVDGFCEVIEDKITGFIVKKCNINEISDVLFKLINDEELRIRIGKNGRKRVEEFYAFDKNVEYMSKVYDEVSLRKDY